MASSTAANSTPRLGDLKLVVLGIEKMGKSPGVLIVYTPRKKSALDGLKN